MVERLKRRLGDREVRGSNLGAGETFFVDEKSLADEKSAKNHSRIVKMDGWMRARDRARARSRQPERLFRSDREKSSSLYNSIQI